MLIFLKKVLYFNYKYPIFCSYLHILGNLIFYSGYYYNQMLYFIFRNNYFFSGGFILESRGKILMTLFPGRIQTFDEDLWETLMNFPTRPKMSKENSLPISQDLPKKPSLSNFSNISPNPVPKDLNSLPKTQLTRVFTLTATCFGIFIFVDNYKTSLINLQSSQQVDHKASLQLEDEALQTFMMKVF